MLDIIGVAKICSRLFCILSLLYVVLRLNMPQITPKITSVNGNHIKIRLAVFWVMQDASLNTIRLQILFWVIINMSKKLYQYIVKAFINTIFTASRPRFCVCNIFILHSLCFPWTFLALFSKVALRACYVESKFKKPILFLEKK